MAAGDQAGDPPRDRPHRIGEAMPNNGALTRDLAGQRRDRAAVAAPFPMIGLAIAPGPFMVPVTSLLLAGRLIARFGAAAVVTAGLTIFAAGVVVWAVLAGPDADLTFGVLCVIPSGIGVGLTLPTLMGLGTAALPASSFATGSGVINMVRQIGFAVGVAIFVAIVGSAASPDAHRAAFRLAWWAMAGITALGLVPLLLLRPGRRFYRPIPKSRAT